MRISGTDTHVILTHPINTQPPTHPVNALLTHPINLTTLSTHHLLTHPINPTPPCQPLHSIRLEREDREEQFEAACQRLRASAESESLQENFATVLSILTDIEESYRVYHGKACFASDRYPLYLIDEFKRYTTTMATMFDMIPYYKHPILIRYINNTWMIQLDTCRSPSNTPSKISTNTPINASSTQL